MARLNTGGRSVRIDVAVSPELYAEIERYMEEQEIEQVSEVARVALAELVGRPELAEGMKRGRRWPEKKKETPKPKRKKRG